MLSDDMLTERHQGCVTPPLLSLAKRVVLAKFLEQLALHIPSSGLLFGAV